MMLPYTPLHYLLFNGSTPPFAALVMTSGNLSEEPIATGNEEARQRLNVLADAFLMHDRDIHTRCDDSVARIFDGKAYPLRRSRGYAPDSISLPIDIPSILATGPELKNTFCLTRDRYAFPSHHIGDMENYETLKSFEEGINQFERLFRIKPQAIAYDMHPNYLSTRYALERAERENLPAIGVQHHHAHIAACMADNGMDGSHPVIGAAFDGTGYGEDGAIWGGEFTGCGLHRGTNENTIWITFRCPEGMLRSNARRARRLPCCGRWELNGRMTSLPSRISAFEDRLALRIQLERRLNTPQTSSMGRLVRCGCCPLREYGKGSIMKPRQRSSSRQSLNKTETGSYQFRNPGREGELPPGH